MHRHQERCQRPPLAHQRVLPWGAPTAYVQTRSSSSMRLQWHPTQHPSPAARLEALLSPPASLQPHLLLALRRLPGHWSFRRSRKPPPAQCGRSSCVVAMTHPCHLHQHHAPAPRACWPLRAWSAAASQIALPPCALGFSFARAHRHTPLRPSCLGRALSLPRSLAQGAAGPDATERNQSAGAAVSARAMRLAALGGAPSKIDVWAPA